MENKFLENVPTKREILWQNVLLFIYIHMSALYGISLLFTQAKFSTIIFTLILTIYSVLSVTLGCHRLWAHNAYRANIFLKFIFVLGHTLMCQGSVYDWILDHRIHHKHYGTELDPYNYKNGFIFAQISSRLLTRSPEIEKARNSIDMSDIQKDPIVMWQKTLYWFIMPVVGIFFPINFPLEYFDESITVSIFVAGFLRIAISLHYAWLITSATNLWGLDPADRRSADTNLIFLVNKSYWPVYHYLVPWDYQVGEYGNYGDGFCNAALRVLAAIGIAYNFRTVDTNGIRKAVYESTKTGKPLTQLIRQQEKTPNYDEMISYTYKGRI